MTGVYTRPPVLYLPSGTAPLADKRGGQPGDFEALAAVENQAASLYRKMSCHVLPPTLFQAEAAGLGAALEQVTASLTPTWQEMSAEYGDPVRAFDTTDLSDDIVIDQMFCIVRAPGLSRLELAAQLALTCENVVGDLPYTLLNLDEILAMLLAIQQMFGLLAQSSSESNRQAPADRKASATTRAFAAAWATPPADPDKRTQQVAAWRWLVGHHFFFLVTLFCTEHLQGATTALREQRDAEAMQQLDRATLYLRATTAAMWYAANFSAEAYSRYVRPGIVRPDTGEGLSGTEMSDYKRMHAAKDELLCALRDRFGENSRNWPRSVYDAVKNFYEIYLEDMEHHTLIAAAKVLQDSSLAQKVWQEDLPDEVPMMNAVEVLREMGSLRKAEFSL